MKPSHSLSDADLAVALRALGHPARLEILRILSRDERGTCCCADVTESLPLAQSTVSQHIKVLLEARLIERQPRGTRNCYVVRRDRLESVSASCAALFSTIRTDLAPEPVPA